MASDLGFQRVCIKTNCLQLFEARRRSRMSSLYFISVINDCRDLVPAFDYFFEKTKF